MTEAAQTRRRPGQALIGIVDGDGSLRLALATWLRSMGMASQTFVSGLDLLGSELAQFSCLIMEQRLRCMTGLETLQAIRQRGCQVPVILVSAHDVSETRRRAAASGAFAFVSKPFSDRVLMGAVRHALDSGRGGLARPAQ